MIHVMMLIWTTNLIVGQRAQRKLFSSLPSDNLNSVSI